MFHEVFVLANTEEVPAPNAEGVVLPPTGSQQPQVSASSVEWYGVWVLMGRGIVCDSE